VRTKRVHDATTATKDNGVVAATARQKDFRIPKSSILESASEGEFRAVQIPSVETEEDGTVNELEWRQSTKDDTDNVVASSNEVQ